MIQNDVNELLELVSPKYYQEFRRLYNELLGYLEREEYDQLDGFSKRIEGFMSKAYFAQVALQRRLKDHKRQDGALQKTVLHDRFRKPKNTIGITHPFPLKKPLAETPLAGDSSLESKPQVSTDLDKLSQSDSQSYSDSHSIKHQRELAELAVAMSEYDKHQQDQSTDDSVPTINDSTVSSTLDAAATGPNGKVINNEPVNNIEHDAQADGAMTDELKDNSLYFKKKGQSKDVDRAAEVKKNQAEKLMRNAKKKADKDAKTSDQPLQNRKERIWDYIEKDQSSGGINHDL